MSAAVFALAAFGFLAGLVAIVVIDTPGGWREVRRQLGEAWRDGDRSSS